MLVNVKSNEQLDKAAADLASAEARLQQGVNELEGALVKDSLAKLTRNRWDQALRAKKSVEQQMMKNLRQSLGQYEPDKLSAIKKMGGSEVFIGITGTKSRHVLAWLDDTLDQPSGPPWSIEPTPVSTLPDDLMGEINASYTRTRMLAEMQKTQATGEEMDIPSIMSSIQDRLPTIQADVLQMVRDKAKEKAALMRDQINDLLTEGGWYKALMSSLFDLVIVKNAFIKGPIDKMQVVRKSGPDGKIVTDRQVKKVWERVSPFDIYPEPDSSGINDGYLFHHVAYRRKDLMALIGVDGYDEAEIRAVLREHSANGLHDWTGIEAQRAGLEGKDTSAIYESEKIEGLEFYGSVSGTTLLENNLTKEQISDKDLDYDVIIYLIGNHVIKATLNENPYGNKPFSTAGYEDQPDAFWKKPLPEKLVDLQTICNAAARALVNNVGMGSGPQVEINMDRLSPVMKGDVSLTPWKKWLTTNKMMQTGKAIEFWQAQMHANELMEVYQGFSKVADEQSIPAFAHGDTQVGGAGNTASGLSMLITQASRGIKSVIKNIDKGLIIPSIEGLYDEISLEPKYRDMVGDLNLVARGSNALIEKEQRAVRMLEMLQATNNPVDQQLTGAEGRGYLLEETARAHGIDSDKMLVGLKKMRTSKGMAPEMTKIATDQATAENAGAGIPGAEAPAGGSPPAAANLDEAGNPVQGTANQLITGEGGHPPVV